MSYNYLPQMVVNSVLGTGIYVKGTDYDAAGCVVQRGLGVNSSNPRMVTQYTYTPWCTPVSGGKLEKINSGLYADSDSLQDLRYTYDNNGNILTIQDFIAGSPQTQTFTYDNLNRLVSAQAAGGNGGIYGPESYIYNSSTGNLESKNSVTLTYPAATPQGCVTNPQSSKPHAATAFGSNTYN